MKNKVNTTEIAKLVEPDRVHKRVYTDADIFELEMDRLWGQAWIFVGHESQVKKPGDYFATTVARQPVIMIRGENDEISVLFNRCPHKGAQLIGDERGSARQIRCAYHGYVFNSDGAVKHIPQAEGYENTAVCNNGDPFRVQKVPRVDNYRGFVFASLAAEGDDLLSWLGNSTTSFDNAVDRSPEGEIEISGGCMRYMHDANWKIILENISDNMHAPVTHQSAWQTAKQLGERYDNTNKPMVLNILEPFGESYDFLDKVAMTTFSKGHSYSGGSLSIHSDYPVDRQYVQALEQRHGKDRTRDILSMNRQNTVIYPSIALKTAVQIIRIYRPVAVNKTLQETWTYKLKGAPEELFEDSVFYNHLIFSPASIAGHDDYEAYHRVQHGLLSQASDWVSQHRHQHGDQLEEDGTSSSLGTSDTVFRHEFRAWLAYMTADT